MEAKRPRPSRPVGQKACGSKTGDTPTTTAGHDWRSPSTLAVERSRSSSHPGPPWKTSREADGTTKQCPMVMHVDGRSQIMLNAMHSGLDFLRRGEWIHGCAP